MNIKKHHTKIQKAIATGGFRIKKIPSLSKKLDLRHLILASVLASPNVTHALDIPCGSMAGIRPECSLGWKFSMENAMRPGASHKVLQQFMNTNPGLFSPNIFGRSVVSNAYQPYGELTYLGSPYARSIQANAYQLMDAIVYNGLFSGVYPYIGFPRF